MPGPIPKPPNQTRRPSRGTFTYLPTGGRKGKAPPWPLGEPTARELDVWRRLWRLPQAAAWEAGGAFDITIARYAWLKVSTEGDTSASMLGELRQLEDRLGLNPVSMARLRWVVDDHTEVEQESDHVLDIRDRLGSRRPTRI